MSHGLAARRSADLRRRGLALMTTVAMLGTSGIHLAMATGVNAVPAPLACSSVATLPYTLAPGEVLTVSLDPGTCWTASVPASGYFGVGTVDLHFIPSVGFSRLAAGETASENYDSARFTAPSTAQAGAVQFTVGSVSFEIAVVVPATAPDAPTTPSATGDAHQIDLAWTVPANDGGSAVTGYRIDVSDADASSGFTTLVASQLGRSFSDTGLGNGQTRWYRVYAINAEGTSSNYIAVSATTTTPSVTVPGAPASGSATGGSNKVDLAWAFPADDGGSAVINWRIDSSDVSGSTGFTTLNEGFTRFGTYADTGLGDSQTRWYRIYAINAQGTSSNYLALSGTSVTSSVPGAPASGSATGGTNKVDLAWTVPANDGGWVVTGYAIEVSDVSGSTGFAPFVANQAGLSYSDTGLGDGVTRWYRVNAINAQGTGGSYLALSGTTAIPVVPTPGGGGSLSPAVDSGSGSSESAVAKVPVVAAPVRPQAATSLIRQTARIKAPSSGRFAVGTDVVLAKKAVKTSAGVTVRWSRVKASKGICSVATVRGRAVATMLKPGTCTVVGKAAAPSSAFASFQTTRTYRVR